MKKIILVLMLVSLLLAGCSAFTGGSTQTVSDEEMATRVAQLLSTMTTPTPTQEFEFPATPTQTSTAAVVTATPEASLATPVVAAGEPALTATVVVATATTMPTATVAVTEAPAATAIPSTAEPSATATVPASDPALTLGNPTSADSMDNASKWTWPTGEDSFLKVAFNNGSMQMTGLTNYAGWRLPLINQQVNSYIELTANSGTCKGKDSYGIIFRVPVFKDPTQGYLFEVTCDGYYRLWKWDGKASTNGLATTLVAWKQSSLINAGANQSNRLGVKVKDKTFTLYMNGVELASATDSAFGAGFFGVFVRSAETANYTVNFDSMRYWENP
ncbi:MAG: hypothetical protein AB9897_06070 [Anaerolineaceae bacterium]